MTDNNGPEHRLDARAKVAVQFDPENTPDAPAAFRDKIRREMEHSSSEKPNEETMGKDRVDYTEDLTNIDIAAMVGPADLFPPTDPIESDDRSETQAEVERIRRINSKR